MSGRPNSSQRKDYLRMAERRAKPGSGSHPQMLRERTLHYGSPDLKRWLGDVPFVVIGGLATRLYMPERKTLDVDVLVSPAVLPAAEEALTQSDCTKLGPVTVGRSTWRLPGSTNLDLHAPADPWVEGAVNNAVRGGDGLPYVALPFLVLLKLASGRVQDLADITRMMSAADEDGLRQTRDHVKRWRPEDAEDLESVIRLGKLEYQDG